MSLARNLHLEQAVLLEDTTTLLKYLADPQASLSIVNPHTLFTLALETNKLTVLALLAAHDAKFNVGARMDKSIQPIHLEAAAGNIKAACQLAEDPALFWCETGGSTAIELAAQAGEVATVCALLESKALSSKPHIEQVNLLNSLVSKLLEFDFDEHPESLLTCLTKLLIHLNNISGNEPSAWALIAEISDQLAGLAKNRAQSLINPLSSESHAKALYLVHPYDSSAGKNSPLKQNSLFASQNSDSEFDDEEYRAPIEKYQEWGLEVSPGAKNNIFDALIDQFIFQNIFRNQTVESLCELTLNHIEKNAEHYKDAKVKKFFSGLMQDNHADAWVDARRLLAAARVLKLNVLIVESRGDNLPLCFSRKDALNTVYLGFTDGAHFQSLHYQTLNPVLNSLFEAAQIDDFSFSENELPAARDSSKALPAPSTFDDLTEDEREAIEFSTPFSLKN